MDAAPGIGAPDSGLVARRPKSRADIDHERLAFYGLSTGGDAGIILTALESRLKASVLQGTRLWDEPTPEIDPRHYAPRVTLPTLMLNGRYDFLIPFETTQRPLFDLLGVQPEHKRHVALDTGHAVPPGIGFANRSVCSSFTDSCACRTS